MTASDVADLLPGDVHVFLLVLLDHARAEAGGHAEARIEIELVDPVAVVRQAGSPSAVGQQPLDGGVPAAVQRRRDQRIRIERILRIGNRLRVGAGLLVVVRQVQEIRDAGLNRLRVAV